MQKRIASLFLLSFLLFALALCIVPAFVQHTSKTTIQVTLIIIAVIVDVVAMRYLQKHTARH